MQTDVAEQLRQQLPGGADERLSLFVLVEARRLADEHQIGVWFADAEDDLGAPAGETALGAGERFLLDDLEGSLHGRGNATPLCGEPQGRAQEPLAGRREAAR